MVYIAYMPKKLLINLKKSCFTKDYIGNSSSFICGILLLVCSNLLLFFKNIVFYTMKNYFLGSLFPHYVEIIGRISTLR